LQPQLTTELSLLMAPHRFAECIPKLWNSVPTTLRHSTLTLTVLKPAKNSPVGLAYGSAL